MGSTSRYPQASFDQVEGGGVQLEHGGEKWITMGITTGSGDNYYVYWGVQT